MDSISVVTIKGKLCNRDLKIYFIFNSNSTVLYTNKEIHQSMLLNKKSEKKLLHSTFCIGWLKPSFNC